MLLVFAYLYSHKRSVLLVDEPDAHLEILRQKQVYVLLRDIASENGSQVVMVTHSEVILDEALEKADRAGFAARKAESAKRGKLRGFGIGQFLEVTAPLTKELGGIRFEADGTVTLLTGSHDHGQGHWTPMAQIVSQRLGVPFDKIRLMQTDSDQLKTGSGTGGSKSLMSSGTAFVHASDNRLFVFAGNANILDQDPLPEDIMILRGRVLDSVP